MSRRERNSRTPWSWEEVRERTLAVYQSSHGGRLRTAVLVWQGDDPRVEIDEGISPLLAFTLDVEPEPGHDNAVALAGFDSLETARRHCIEWVGEPAETGWEALGETAQIGIYASIREPDFAARP